MKRVLITGASGFVGANLTRRLVELGDEVHAVIRHEHPLWRLESIASDVVTHDADLVNPEQIEGVVRKVKPEWIFHLAVYGAYPFQTDVRQMNTTNIVGTVNLLEACRREGFERFINTGSSSEYGYKNYAPSEDENPDPNSYYAITKSLATTYCSYAAKHFGLPLTTLRLYSAFGPFEEPTRLIPTLVLQGLRGRLPPLVDPMIARDYVHVEDVVSAYLATARCSTTEPGMKLNVGSGTQTDLRTVVECARRILDVGEEPQWGSFPARAWDTSVWVADNRRIKALTGWRPELTFEQGLMATIEWFRQNPELQQFYRKSNPILGG